MNKFSNTSLMAVFMTCALSGCNHMTSTQSAFLTGSGQEMAMMEASQTQSVVTLKDVLDAEAGDIPTLTAMVCSTHHSLSSEAQKRLMAIRSARMAAMRDLAEQIHGLQVDSSTTVIDLMVQNDTFRGVVSGTIRGARTVRINPTGSDTYEVVLEIDREMIGYLLSTARQSV